MDPVRRSLALTALLLTSFSNVAATSPFGFEYVRDRAVSQSVSLAIGSDGDSRVAYIEFTDTGENVLFYAEQQDGEWVHDEVTVAVNPSLCKVTVGSDGEPGILYDDSPTTGFYYAFRSNGVWANQIVDGNASPVSFDGVWDAAGTTLHVCYHDGSDRPMYVTRSGGLWSATEMIDTIDSGISCRIALDSAGVPHVAYYTRPDYEIVLATKSGQSWTPVPTGELGTSSLSLVIDSRDDPLVASPDSAGLRLIWPYGGGLWAREYVDTSPTAREPDLVLDSQDLPHLSYRDLNEPEIRYAKWTGVGWETETTGLVGYFARLRLDEQGRARLVFHAGFAGSPAYAESHAQLLSPAGGELWPAGSRQTVRWRGLTPVSISLSSDGGGTWMEVVPSATGGAAEITVPDWATESARVRLTVLADPTYVSDSPGTFTIGGSADPWWSETAAAVSSVGYFTSIDLGPHEVPAIAYYDVSQGDLVVATRVGGGWVDEAADSAGDVGAFCSLALDGVGDAHVGYADVDNSDVKYATRIDGVWSTETADSMGTLGAWLSLALDGAGEPHLSYQDNTAAGALRYAHKSGGGWSLELVDASSPSMGEHTSIAVAAGGAPGISYYDAFSQDLRFAARVGGIWLPTVVDAGGTTGQYTSLAFDATGEPHISYYDATNGDLRYARRAGSWWILETVDSAGDVGLYTSIALDESGNPHIAYQDATNLDLCYARRVNGAWAITRPDTAGSQGAFTSLDLDAQGNARISHLDVATLDVRYVSRAVEIGAPATGTVWPVGAARTVTWDGTGSVDLSLSVDGGSSWQTLATGLSGGDHAVLVPHTPTRFAQLRLERDVPRSDTRTGGLFSIESSVQLLSFGAAPPASAAQGVRLEWATDPGPEDLAGYRVARSAAGGWTDVASLTRETALEDPDGGPGSRYRLFAVNGLNEEYLVGETAIAAPQALAMWPLPFRGGELSVSFSTLGGFGDGRGPAEIVVHDVAGRRVRTVARGDFGAGTHVVTWDGRDEGGRSVASGVYFVRVNTAGNATARKVTVLR